MPVVNAGEFALRRARRELEKAFKRSSWEDVRHWDAKLGHFLDTAFEDENRDTDVLVVEMENILGTYADMLERLPENVPGFVSRQE